MTADRGRESLVASSKRGTYMNRGATINEAPVAKMMNKTTKPTSINVSRQSTFRGNWHMLAPPPPSRRPSQAYDAAAPDM